MIWEWDHARPCSIEEWDYWMNHVLPFGWSLLSEPVRAKQSTD